MYIHKSILINKLMQTKIQKWGNSQGIRVSKELLKEIGLESGNSVNVLVDKDRIIIRKADGVNLTLAELVSKIPKNHKYKYPDMFGDPVGKEIW